MASQRTWEKLIWANIAATVDAGSWEDTIPELSEQRLSKMTDAERRRLSQAFDRVMAVLYRHAQPRRKRKSP